MPSQKSLPGSLAENFVGPRGHLRLRASHIGEQRLRRHCKPQTFNQVDNRNDRGRQNNHFTSVDRIGGVRIAFVDRPLLVRTPQHPNHIRANDVPDELVLLEGESERAADQSVSNDGDSSNRHGMSGKLITGVEWRTSAEISKNAYCSVRPTAGAITRNSFINVANCSGNSDCAPSESALSGLLCSSISSASAPAATAARAIGATLSRRPVP